MQTVTKTAFYIALIEDDPIMGESLLERLALEGYEVAWYRGLAEARDGLARRTPQAVISDIRLPDGSGDELLPWMKQHLDPLPDTLFITGYGTIDQAVRLLKQGAVDYLTKPLDVPQLLSLLERLCSRAESVDAASASRALGVSPAMQAIEAKLVRLAEHPEVPVLFHGESGVGKEVAARFLHGLQCPEAPFEAINCASVPDTLIGSELFGHERGAFTGADRQRQGLFERAAAGFAFLDEIGDMPLDLQPVLLRTLQERSFARLGGDRELPIEARILFATHQDLKQRVTRGKFREDLYYRINVVQISIPPLRERREDIAWLAERFVHHYNRENPGAEKRLTSEALDYLVHQTWPGNVRQLQNTIQRACILGTDDIIRTADVSEGSGAGLPDGQLREHLAHDERDYIIAMLRAHGLRVSETAHALGISRKTLWQKMKRLGIDRDRL